MNRREVLRRLFIEDTDVFPEYSNEFLNLSWYEYKSDSYWWRGISRRTFVEYFADSNTFFDNLGSLPKIYGAVTKELNL